MSSKNINDDATLAYLFKKVWDAVYPVGSIYVSANDTSPERLFGGKWRRIEGAFLLAAGGEYKAGDTGGKAEYVASDMPKHSHTRGTMEIRGTLSHNNTYSGTPYSSGFLTGAFASKGISGTQYYLSGRSSGSGWCDVDFAASRSWTGATSESGTNETAEIMPPYRVVNVWERTA